MFDFSKKEPLFKIANQDDNMHEYIIYTDGSVEGFPGAPIIFNYFRRICKKCNEEVNDGQRN